MATTSSVGRSFPTLRYLAAPFRWFFRSRRRVWTTAAVLLAMIAVPPLWWSLQLVGLPDIGEPFDVAGVPVVPDPRRPQRLRALSRGGGSAQAAGRARARRTSRRSTSHAPWSQADPAARRWVEDEPRGDGPVSAGDRAARRARTGTGLGSRSRPGTRSRASDRSRRWPCSRRRGWRSVATWRGPGAGIARRCARPTTWDCAGRSSCDWSPSSWHAELRRRSAPWAADSRTTPDLIRRAIDDTRRVRDLLALGVVHAQGRIPLSGRRARPDRSNPGRQLLIGRLAARFGRQSYQLDPDQVGRSPMPGGPGGGSRSGAVG